MKVGVVIVCAGRGARLKHRDKSALNLNGKPLFSHALRTFLSLKQIKQIVLVFREDQLSRLKNTIFDKRVVLACGGRQRRDSVNNGLLALSEDIDSVLIHDGARPFVTKKSILRLIEALKNNPAVILSAKVTDTLKLANKGRIKKTVKRDNIYRAQTPQGFRKKLIVKAYAKFKAKTVTDDAQLVELLGKRVKIIEGDRYNIKITYPEDLNLAKAICKFKR